DVGRRLLFSPSYHASAVKTQSYFTQEVHLRFPKPHFMITASDGANYPVVSVRLLREAGTFVLFVPLVTAMMIYWRRYWGLWVATMGLGAVLVPAMVDFGAQNVESYRFLFFGGVAAAMACGVAVGMWLDWIAPRGPLPSWAKVVVLIFLAVSCGTAVRRTADNFLDVMLRPREYYSRAEDWGCRGACSSNIVEPGHWPVALQRRPLVQSGGD